MTTASTTIFLRDEAAVSDSPFVAVEHSGSITLQTLMDSHDCSCVVECDETGRAQPRAIVIDDPKEQLHRGTFYLSRSRKRRERDDAACDAAAACTTSNAAQFSTTAPKAVHFNTRVAVREYSIPPPGTAVDHGDHDGRPSLDLFAFNATTTAAPQPPSATLKQQTSQLCFKAFTVCSPADGTAMTMTLDVFHKLVEESKARLEGAAERHQQTMKEIEDIEAFLQQHDKLSQSNDAEVVQVNSNSALAAA